MPSEAMFPYRSVRKSWIMKGQTSASKDAFLPGPLQVVRIWEWSGPLESADTRQLPIEHWHRSVECGKFARLSRIRATKS